MASTNNKKRPPSRYSRIWAAARAMGMSTDDVHDLVYRETRKDSLTKLSETQITKIGNLMWDMANGRSVKPVRLQRTDEGGRPDTVQQRRRIYMEARKIGWSEQRVDGLALKDHGVSSQKWLTPTQCSDLIEALKAIVDREKRPDVSQLMSILNNRIEQLTAIDDELAG